MKKKLFSRYLAILVLAAGFHNISTAQGKVANVGFTDLIVEPQQLSQIAPENIDVDTARANFIRIGLSKMDVLRILGEPFTKTSVDRREAWEYRLSLPLADKRSSIVCQFMVIYGNATLSVDDAYWRRPQCATAGNAHILPSDFSFGFDKYQLNSSGIQALKQIAGKLSQQDKSLRIMVVGYTDRIGSAAYNQILSERRAESVAQYLMGQGLPRHMMNVAGRGESEPVVECQGVSQRLALKDCLAPNRRVVIQLQPA